MLATALAAMPAPVTTGAVVLAASSMTACGPSCGDGEINAGEQCDDGNDNELDTCRSCMSYSIPVTTLRWSFNDQPDVGFGGDGCFDVGASSVHVELTGPDGVTPAPAPKVMDGDCGGRQVVFQDLAAGTYHASIDVLAPTGASLLTEPYLVDIVSTGVSETFATVIPYTQWTTAYTGTFFFRLTFDGGSCELATPPVVTQNLRLRIGGVLYDGVTDTNQPLDGSGPAACRSSDDEFPQSSLTVPFGPATLQVDGIDDQGNVAFTERFDTFVGAGISNPTLEFALANADMPPDAALPDAALPDAATPDAMP